MIFVFILNAGSLTYFLSIISGSYLRGNLEGFYDLTIIKASPKI